MIVTPETIDRWRREQLELAVTSLAAVASTATIVDNLRHKIQILQTAGPEQLAGLYEQSRRQTAN